MAVGEHQRTQAARNAACVFVYIFEITVARTHDALSVARITVVRGWCVWIHTFSH